MNVFGRTPAWTRRIPVLTTTALLATLTLFAVAEEPDGFLSFNTSSGRLGTFSTLGSIPHQSKINPFFLPVFVNGRTNGKTCEHCHFASDGWGLLVDHADQLFAASQGLHPLFTPDAADNPAVASIPANVATLAQRQQVYSLMLKHGLALVRVNKPASAEFDVIGVDDASIPELSLAANQVTVPISSDGGSPTVQAGDPAKYFAYTQQFNNATFGANVAQFWFHRRPLPTTNMQFLSEVSWEGRSTPQPSPSAAQILAGATKVAHDTIIARQNGVSLDAATQNSLATQMTAFMLRTTTAETFDSDSNDFGAKVLTQDGAHNGPINLFQQPFFTGINDPFLPGFNAIASMIYSPGWAQHSGGPVQAARAKILRGQALFNGKQIQIMDVKGLNDRFGIASVTGTCTTCHNTPNVGNHSSRLDVALGVAGITVNGDGTKSAPAGLNQDAIADLPVFTLQNKTTSEIVHVTDLGLAAATGKWDDIGKFKVALPRTLEGRSPYFHNGGPTTLEELVSFYDNRFHIGFSPDEASDLIAFLKSL
jgi:hypothetical protein